MLTFAKISGLKEFLHSQSGKSVGFVPTMGALHEGHLDLVRRARLENEVVVASIFVNPIQFNNPEDLDKYPRMPEADSHMLRSAGCDVLFAPEADEMYPEPEKTVYDFGSLALVMEGASRPGHFNGVAIVVRKLFEIVEPHKAYFGEKDFQQLAIIRQLVRLCSIPVEIIPCATVREADGLAMSSRNMRLTPEERSIAPKIYRALQAGALMKKTTDPVSIKNFILQELNKEPAFTVDYVEIADDTLLQPINDWNQAKGALIFTAVFLGKVRLIDNIRIF
jgi:pantoate--beta-alanine ligase